jgi:hypothetical protein
MRFCFLLHLSRLSADGLAKYLFDWKAPVSTKGLDEPSCFIYIFNWLYGDFLFKYVYFCLFHSLCLYYLPSMGLELANLDSDFLWAIIFPW